MPTPRKRKDETWREYRNRLIKHYIEYGYPTHQAIAIAYRVAEKKQKEQKQKNE